MDSNQPPQEVPIVIRQPAQLSAVAPESPTDQNLNSWNERTTIYIINMLPPTSGKSLVAPLSPSSPSDFVTSGPTTFPTPSSPPSSHVPLSPPPTPPGKVDSAHIPSTTTNLTRKRKYSKEENSPLASSKRIFKHQINLEDEANQNLPEKQRKSIEKSKSCKEQRVRKAMYLAQLESDNQRLRQENSIIPQLNAEISRLREELQMECSKLKDKDHVISELKAKNALLEGQINEQTGAIPTDLRFPDLDHLGDIDFVFTV